MNPVRVFRKKVLERMRSNKESHLEIFLEASEWYRKQAIRELESMLKEARAGLNIRRVVTLEEPMDQTRAYDLIIDMLETCVDETIELTVSDFNKYMRDEWDWKNQFIESNTKYIGT